MEIQQKFPYNAVPQVNNFVYPPLRSLDSVMGQDIATDIGLDQHSQDGVPFAIFVSIPYCEVRCHSCHMFKGLLPAGQNRESHLEQYLDSIFRQIDAYAGTRRFSDAHCGAIYLGGGTASLLTADQITRLVHKLTSSFQSVADIELTLEGNPNDFSFEYLNQVRMAGITRLSIGYQSADPTILRALNSPHQAVQGLASVRNALAVGFPTVNVDLLFNVPGQTESQWQRDLEILINMGPQGISPGDYVVFSGSAAELLISKGSLSKQVELDVADRWYQQSRERLERAGFTEQVRNIFARPGHPYKYVDLACLQNREIIGLGAGAYSFIGGRQFQTASDGETYKSQIRAGHSFCAVSMSARATDRNLMERFIIHNLFASVLNRKIFFARFAVDPLDAFVDTFTKLISHGLMAVDNEYVRLTELGQKWRRNIYYEFRAPEYRTAADDIVCVSAVRQAPLGSLTQRLHEQRPGLSKQSS